MTSAPPLDWFPKRGEVYWAQVDKNRPVIILSVDALNQHAHDVCVLPLTRVCRKRFRLRVQVEPPDGGLQSTSWAKCDQVTTLEKALLVYPALGSLTATTLRQVADAVRMCLGLQEV